MTNFSRKLHENEEILVQTGWGGGGGVSVAPLDPPLDAYPLIAKTHSSTIASNIVKFLTMRLFFLHFELEFASDLFY